jgi:hypothetical protein
MNAGLGEEIGQTSRSAIEAMKAQPLMLAVLLLNVILMGFIFFAVQKARDYEAQTRASMVDLLSKCFANKSNFTLQSDESKPAQVDPMEQ